MTTKQELTTPAAASCCGNCGVKERRLLHHLRHRGIFRRLCTSCVLKLNIQHFCPTCFLVYDRTPSQNDTVTCFKCYSYNHPHCVGPAAPKPYICPLCANPNPSAPLFSLKRARRDSGDGDGGEEETFREIDGKAARVLLAAAKIAEVSLSRAAEGARSEAEKRAKEAAFARKRAREALEHVAFLMAKEKLKIKEIVSAEVSGSMNAVDLREKERVRGFRAQNAVSGNPNNGVVQKGVEDNDRLRVNSVSRVSGSGNVGATEKNYKGGGCGGNNIGVPVRNRILNQLREDGASQDLKSLDAVDLKENERLEGFTAQNAVSGLPLPNNCVPMGVEDNDRSRTNSVSNDHGMANENEGSAELGLFEGNNGQGEKVINGPFSGFPVGDQMQHMESSS